MGKGNRSLMMKLFVAAGACFVCIAQNANAAAGECLLEINNRSYMDGPCNIVLQRGGSFSIGVGARRSKYFAYVSIDAEDGVARGYWNGEEAASHAHEELGTLVRQGACWVNSQAKVCAWRPGTRKQ
jgi:hypothetical protein